MIPSQELVIHFSTFMLLWTQWSSLKFYRKLKYIYTLFSIIFKCYLERPGASLNWFKPSSKIFLLTVPRWCFFCGSFMLFLSYFVMLSCTSVCWCLVVTCLEMADLLALVCDVYLWRKEHQIRPGVKYIEKYSNTLQLLSLINDYNYITITGPVEM